jgi:threonine dehydratase
MEILRQVSGKLDAVFVPVGGGGLIAGISSYIKYLRPDVKVIGVEAEDSACLQAAFAAGRRVTLKHTGIFADGVAVAQIGKEPFRIAQECVDDVVTANSDEICAAIKDLFDDTRSIAEPAGALALAGLKNYAAKHGLKDCTLLAVQSGANVNFDRLRYVSERYEIGQHTEALLAVTIPEKPGSLMRLCDIFEGHDISEFNYRYADNIRACVFVGVHIKGGNSDRKKLLLKLAKAGYEAEDLTDNALAKLHVCHMIGGHAGVGKNEQLYRFEFPERAGVLKEFLTVLRDRWNISLFHYRRHGGSYANVFVGLQAIPGSRHSVKTFLKELGYPYVCESDNPAYIKFLK